MPLSRHLPILRYSLTVILTSMLWMSMKTVAHEQESAFIMPNLAEMIVLALDHGEVNAITGQRHFTGPPVLQWEKDLSNKRHTSIFHAYGFGGSGLTLAPSVAEYIASQVELQIHDDHRRNEDSSEIVILGAGYIGIFAALEINHRLNHNREHKIPIRVVAQAYPKGITEINPDKTEPVWKDNYSSMTAGGWVMPVSIEPLKNRKLWCELVQRAQTLWHSYTRTPPLNTATHITQSLVFYDQLSNAAPLEDKSGIRTVNAECPSDLYPEHSFKSRFYGWEISGDNVNPLHFDQVVAFDNVIQTDTVSVLQYMTQQLSAEGVELIQTEAMIDSFEQLQHFFGKNQKTIVINASGHGAHSVFHNKPSTPVRGDLVVLRIPTEQLTDPMKEVSHYGFWAGGCHYVFLRYSLDGKWMEVVLGGTFIKDDHDLMSRPETIQHIVTFWLDFFHHTSTDEDSHTERDALVNRVLNTVKM